MSAAIVIITVLIVSILVGVLVAGRTSRYRKNLVPRLIGVLPICLGIHWGLSTLLLDGSLIGLLGLVGAALLFWFVIWRRKSPNRPFRAGEE